MILQSNTFWNDIPADVILSSEAKQKEFYPGCNLHIILFTFQMKSWSAIQMLIMLM